MITIGDLLRTRAERTSAAQSRRRIARERKAQKRELRRLIERFTRGE